ncbi:MAG: HypC/HybG/HupF family hydrogenase formation chaperone [Candidatus Acidiferrales bacterium]|jgi:hydrogenase expression/formation protein HypC
MCLAIPGKIVGFEERDGSRTGRVQFGGIVKQVCLDFVPEAALDDYVLVHVGFALTVVDREEAEKTYALLESMGMLAEDLRPDPAKPEKSS